MAILASQFEDFTKNALVKWRDTPAEYQEVANELYTVVNVSDLTSEHSSMSALPTARRWDDTDDRYKGEPKQGYTINYEQEAISLQCDIGYKLRKFDKYDEINKVIRGNKRSVVRRFEQDLASPLSYAWSTTYTNIDGETVSVAAPDGLALISASHVPNASATTYSNQLAGNNSPISQTTLENLLELGNGFLDEADGRSVPGAFNSIITGTHTPTSHEVKRILMSVQAPGTDVNDINVNKGGYKHVVVPYLDFNLSTEQRDSTKRRYCFVANLGDEDMNGFRVEVSEAPNLVAPQQVFDSGVWQYAGQAFYDRGILTSNFIAGTKGDGTTV